MIDIGRWNYETHEYDPYQPDPKWVVVLATDDMELPINCTNCGKDMTFGDGYTSIELHTAIGFGWPVCWFCYQRERDREIESKQAKEHE